MRGGCAGAILRLLVFAVLVGAALWLARRPLLSALGVQWPEGAGGVARLTVPGGLRAEVFASGLQGPRFMALGPEDVVFVANRGAGQVVALRDRDGDGRADEQIVVAGNLDRPSSVAFSEGALYVGETSRVTRLTLAGDLRALETEQVVALASGAIEIHSTRTVLFGPDERLYVSTGSSCNVCRESDPRRAAVWVYPPEGGRGEPFTSGLRNAVGLAVNPWTDTIWATNNGRDLLGDDLPPDAVYELSAGADAGWPRCHAGGLPDPQFGGGAAACEGVLEPAVTLQAHVAPLGLAFYPRDALGPAAFPIEMQGDLYVALHGSWNRSSPVGYTVVRVSLDSSGRPDGSVQDFATGFRDDAGVHGRPTGLLVLPDGSMLVSDDWGGIIYRITRDN